MSQAGLIDIEGSHPQIPTEFVADVGSAIPIANILEILGSGGIVTSGSGNTITIDGSGVSPDFTITGDTGGPISPVADNWNLLGSINPSGTSPLTVVGTAGTLTVTTQYTQAAASSNPLKVGLASFDSNAFDVNASGFVQLNGGGIASTSFTVDTSSVPGTNPVLPNGSGNVTIGGNAVANHSVVIETNSTAANSFNVEIQYGAAVVATDATKSGVVHFDSSDFNVDANGFVTINTAGSVQSIIGTANQVLANGNSGTNETGDVTLTTPQDIATTSDVTFNTVSTPDGSSGSPSFTNTGDTDTGVYFPGDNQVGITAGGSPNFIVKQFTVESNKLHNFFAGFSWNYTSPGAYPYSVLDASDCVVYVDTSIARTINLPNASTDGRVYIIKDATGSAFTNNITITTPGGVVTIDGVTSTTISANYGSIMVQFMSTQYFII